MCGDVAVHVHLIGQGSKPQLSHAARVVFTARQVFYVNALERREKRLTENDKEVMVGGEGEGPARASSMERGTRIGVCVKRWEWDFAWSSERFV